MSHRWNNTWVQGETQHLALQQPFASPVWGRLGFHVCFWINRQQGRNLNSRYMLVTAASLLNWDELVSWGHAGSCLPAGTYCSWKGVRSIPSMHPIGISGAGCGTGWTLHSPDEDGEQAASLLEAEQSGGLGSSPVSRGICTRRQDRCNCWWLSEQLCRLPRPLALNVSFEFSCYF